MPVFQPAGAKPYKPSVFESLVDLGVPQQVMQALQFATTVKERRAERVEEKTAREEAMRVQLAKDYAAAIGQAQTPEDRVRVTRAFRGVFQQVPGLTPEWIESTTATVDPSSFERLQRAGQTATTLRTLYPGAEDLLKGIQDPKQRATVAAAFDARLLDAALTEDAAEQIGQIKETGAWLAEQTGQAQDPFTYQAGLVARLTGRPEAEVADVLTKLSLTKAETAEKVAATETEDVLRLPRKRLTEAQAWKTEEEASLIGMQRQFFDLQLKTRSGLSPEDAKKFSEIRTSSLRLMLDAVKTLTGGAADITELIGGVTGAGVPRLMQLETRLTPAARNAAFTALAGATKEYNAAARMSGSADFPPIDFQIVKDAAGADQLQVTFGGAAVNAAQYFTPPDVGQPAGGGGGRATGMGPQPGGAPAAGAPAPAQAPAAPSAPGAPVQSYPPAAGAASAVPPAGTSSQATVAQPQDVTVKVRTQLGPNVTVTATGGLQIDAWAIPEERRRLADAGLVVAGPVIALKMPDGTVLTWVRDLSAAGGAALRSTTRPPVVITPWAAPALAPGPTITTPAPTGQTTP